MTAVWLPKAPAISRLGSTAQHRGRRQQVLMYCCILRSKGDVGWCAKCPSQLGLAATCDSNTPFACMTLSAPSSSKRRKSWKIQEKMLNVESQGHRRACAVCRRLLVGPWCRKGDRAVSALLRRWLAATAALKRPGCISINSCVR